MDKPMQSNFYFYLFFLKTNSFVLLRDNASTTFKSVPLFFQNNSIFFFFVWGFETWSSSVSMTAYFARFTCQGGLNDPVTLRITFFFFLEEARFVFSSKPFSCTSFYKNHNLMSSSRYSSSFLIHFWDVAKWNINV